MKSSVVTLTIVLALAGCASAQAPATQPVVTLAKDNASPTVDSTLDRLDQVGQSLKDFTADVAMLTTDPNTGNDVTRNGKVWFQSRGKEDSRIRVTFGSRDVGERRYDEKIEYLLQDGILIDRNYDTKVQVKRQVLKPGEKANLLKLGEGPFPLPIGQNKDEVKKLFTVTLIAHAESDPANTVHLKLVPVPETQFANKFASIDVWVDTTSNFPVRIDTADINNTGTRQTNLKNVKVNPNLTDADFTLPPVEGWNLRTEEYKE